MRAIVYSLEGVESSSILKISGEEALHLIKSVRIKIGESVKILDGMGGSAIGEVLCVEKKDIELKISNLIQEKNSRKIDVLICPPKKEAFEKMLSAATEIGVRKIFLAESRFSQRFNIKDSRIDSILYSALKQSNNLFLPQFSVEGDLDSFNFDHHQRVIIAHPDSKQTGINPLPPISKEDEILFVVGPEGGFSKEEIEALRSKSNTFFVSLPTNILRSPTALSFGLGYLCAHSVNPVGN